MATSNLQPVPYISFDGNCAEAMHFYESTFGGKIKSMSKAAETPMAAQMPESFADKIINSQLELPGGFLLMGGDCPPHVPYEGVKGITLTLNYETVAEGEAAFDKLAAGGKVFMPWAPTFWAKMFGMVVDKYGVTWVVNGEPA